MTATIRRLQTVIDLDLPVREQNRYKRNPVIAFPSIPRVFRADVDPFAHLHALDGQIQRVVVFDGKLGFDRNRRIPDTAFAA
jgi:hypothetical protein